MCDRKPNCSYNCLIGMALKSSESGRLPVGEIYRFFEREFPYFLTAAEPWKNSLRHSLSLGHYFRKYNSDKLVTKKGHLWEVDPQRASELDKEMYMFLARGLPDNVPTSPQLSRLRLQMTQLLLDSIKTHPSGSCHGSPHCHGSPQQCHVTLQQPILNAAINYSTPPKPTGAAMYTPQKRALGETLVQTPTGSPLGEFTPRRRSVLCQAASPVVSPGFGQGHRPTVGCFLASTPIARSKQAMISPQLSHHIPRAVSGGGGTMVKRLVSPSQSGVQQVKRSELTAHLQSPRPANSANLHPSRATCRNVQSPCSPRTSTCNGMCSEAYQLMQFCSHCNIGMDGRKSGERKRLQREMASPLHSQPLLLQREKSLSELNQATSRVSSRERVDSLDPKLAELLRENSHHHQQQVEEMQGSSYYPFLAPPTGHRNVSLSQLNTDSNYQLDPGPPKELTVTKCNPRARGDIVRHPTSFDSAVRPVVYDWNGWWEAEHVLCMMNEESFMNYIECRSESTIKDILEQKKQPRSNGAMPRAMSPERCQRRSCSHFGFRRGSGQNWVRRLKIRKPKTPSPPPPPPPREKAKKHKSTIGHHRDLPVGNMKLVVSIPFRQLITDRQMKKYGVSGAKYRIQTDQNVA